MNPRRKLTAEKVREIRRLHADGEKQACLASLFHVAQSAISVIVRRKAWRSIS